MRILVIQGHPDTTPGHFDAALADAYAAGAADGGHELRRLNIAELEFPLLRSQQDWESGEPVADIRHAQDDIRWAEHIVIIYPLWLGDMPALLKGFFEQLARPGFALPQSGNPFGKKPLAGRRARVIVTMGMPALMYELWYRAHSLKSLRRNILQFCGISPVRTACFGLVAANAKRREGFLVKAREWGRQAG